MNINTFDLNLLLVFDAMLRTRSTTLAGERMGLTQSAISNALKRLRQIFDDPLFVKTPDGMMPTPCAERMAEPIQEALFQIRNTIEDRDGFTPDESQRTFRLCVSDVGQMMLLPRLLSHLRTEAPHVNLETIESTPQDAPGLLATGEIDLAIGFRKELGEGFHSQKLAQDHFVCLLRADHPTIRNQLTLEQFLSAAHAEYRPSGGSYSVFEEAVKGVVANRGVLRLAHLAGIASVISHSDLVIVVPRRLAEILSRDSDLQVLSLPFESPVFEVTQQWHGRFHKDPGHRWLRAVIASLFRE